MYKKIEWDACINSQDLMGYADDLLILCDTKHQLSTVIKSIREWRLENNLGLNTSKSGIIEFFTRGGSTKATLNIGAEFDGIPVVAYYKYLGMWVDGTLTMNRQVEAITKKSNWIVIKLWYILRKVSMSYRINIWTILIRPLFEQLSMLYYSERSHINKEMVDRALRMTFKKFTMLKKNVSTAIIDDLMRFNINNRADRNMEATKTKWETRMGQLMYVRAPESQQEQFKEEKTPRLLPKELQEVLNLSTALCPRCSGEVCSHSHMKEEHCIIIPEYKSMILEIERRTKDAKDAKLKRHFGLEHVASFLTIHIDALKKHLLVTT